MNMKAVHARYENGQVKLDEKPELTEAAEVIVIFPDADPWEVILNDPAPRPALSKMADEVIQDHKAGKTEPFPPDFC